MTLSDEEKTLIQAAIRSFEVRGQLSNMEELRRICDLAESVLKKLDNVSEIREREA